MKGTANILRAAFGSGAAGGKIAVHRNRDNRVSRGRFDLSGHCSNNRTGHIALSGSKELAEKPGSYELEEILGRPYNGFKVDWLHQVRNGGMHEIFSKGTGRSINLREGPESCMFHDDDTRDRVYRQNKGQDLFWSEPGSRSVPVNSGRGGKSGLHMAAGSHAQTDGYERRGDPTESATENKPPRVSRGKGEKAEQEPTGPMRERRVHGKPPAEQDQVREESRTSASRSGARRPVSSNVPFAGFHSRVGRSCSTAMWNPDKWLPLPPALCSAGKTEFGLSAHSVFC